MLFWEEFTLQLISLNYDKQFYNLSKDKIYLLMYKDTFTEDIKLLNLCVS